MFYGPIPNKKIGLKATKALEKRFRELGKDVGFWKHGYHLRGTCKRIFRDPDFNGKKVLEIGCGNGIYCIWASIHGADLVVGLEPLSDGTSLTSQCFKNFSRIKRELNLKNIEMVPKTIQEYVCEDRNFDIVLSHSSINHLDPDSCSRLHENGEARENYLEVFRKLKRSMNNGAKLIIMDASSRNFYGDLGINNPFANAKNIKWRTHQQPECWAKLLSLVGLRNQKISWNTGRVLGYLGVFSIPRPMSYFGLSNFRLEMTL